MEECFGEEKQKGASQAWKPWCPWWPAQQHYDRQSTQNRSILPFCCKKETRVHVIEEIIFNKTGIEQKKKQKKRQVASSLGLIIEEHSDGRSTVGVVSEIKSNGRIRDIRTSRNNKRKCESTEHETLSSERKRLTRHDLIASGEDSTTTSAQTTALALFSFCEGLSY